MFLRFLLLFIFFPLLVFSITLEDNHIKYDKFSIAYLYDEQQALSIDEVVLQEFHKAPNQFSFGYREGDAWFKINISNKSQTNKYVLYFTEPLWEQFDFYEKNDQGEWKVSHAGLLIPLEDRQINDVNPAFNLMIPQGESKTFYIKGKSVSAQVGEFQIYSHDEYFRPTRFNITQLYIFYSVVVFIIALFNIYLYLARKEAIYAYYITYLVMFSVWLSILSGYYLLFGFAGWNNGLHAFGAIWIVFLVLFSGAFLELKDRMPHMHYLFYAFAATFALLGLAISLSVPYTPLAFNIISSIFFTILLILSVKIWRQGYLEMRYYLIALIIYMPTMGLMTLTFNNLIDNTDVTRYAFVLGSLLEVLFFNSLMVSRYNALFTKKIRAQGELIEEKEKYEVFLEDEIKARIQELEETNAILLKQTMELQKTKEQLTVQTTIDPLSQLYNRRYLSDISTRIFDTALRYHNALSVIMLDLDDFKQINDTYGHAVGDNVIIECANILKTLVRSSDIVARYGGEEFILIIPHTPQEEVIDLARRILKSTEEAAVNISEENSLHFTLSIGVTHMRESDVTIEQMIHRADNALYTAKAKGKNCIEVT